MGPLRSALGRREPIAKRAQLIARASERRFERLAAHAQVELPGAPALGVEPLLGAFEGQPFLVEEPLDAQDEVEITPAIETLTRGIFLGAQELELRLPVAEDIGRNGRDALALSDPRVELVPNRAPFLRA